MLAQQGILKGKITDLNTGEPLIAASVQVGETGTVTNLDGMFEIGLPVGEYQVAVSYVGYEPFSQAIQLKSNEVTTLEIQLEESANLLKTATVTSGKHEMALGEVTVSLDVISPSLLQNTNQTSLDGLLDKVPGINMVGDQANIRGGSGFSYGAGSRVLLLIDDIPIYQADAGFPQWGDVPLENVEQIEVVKGAASAMYGAGALNGIVNVRTAYAKSKPETFFAPYFTVFSDPKNEKLKWWDDTRYTTGFSGAHRRKIGKLDLVFGGNYYRNNSVKDSTKSRRGRLSVNARYLITDRLSIGLNSNFNRSKGTSFFYWSGVDELYRPGVPISSSDNTRFNIDPYVTWFDGANNRHKLMGRYFSVENNTGTSESDNTNISDMYYGEYQFQRKMEKTGLVVTAGAVYIGTEVQAPLYGDTRFNSRNLAGYAQADKKFFDRLNVSVGLRFENNLITLPDTVYYTLNDVKVDTGIFENGEILESEPVVRFGASYKISETTFLRASWGQGYRFPTIAEKFTSTDFNGVQVSPNFDLQSENGWTAELGLRKGFTVSKFVGFLDVSGFIMDFTDMMEFTFVPNRYPVFPYNAFNSLNIGDTRIKGFELSVNGRGKIGGLQTTLLAGYTYIDPKFKEFGLDYPSGSNARINAQNSSVCQQPDDPNHEKCKNILKYRYKHNVKFDMESRYKNFSLGVAATYTSFMENIDAAFESPLLKLPTGIGLQEWRAAHNEGDFILDLRAAYYITPEIRASLLVNNVFNREYSTRPGQLESTRATTLRVDYNF